MVRNNVGCVVHACAVKKCYVASSLLAELFALKEGAKLAFELGFQNIVLGNDSMVAINKIVGTSTMDSSHMGLIVRDIDFYLNLLNNKKVCFCTRSSNSLTHSSCIWAKFTRKMSSFHLVHISFAL